MIGEGASPSSRMRPSGGSDRRPASPRGARACRGGGGLEDRVARAVLDWPAEIHDHHPVGDMADDRKAVADEQIGEAELGLQVDEQVEDLRLNRQVERRDRLVEDEDAAGSASARARWRCAGAGRRRTCAGSGRSAPGASPTRAIMCAAASRRSAALMSRRLIFSGSSRIAPIFWRGLSEPYGSWKTICTSRRSRARACRSARAMSTPSMISEPPVGGSIIVTIRASVDLPQPDSPTTASVLPASSVKLTPSTARTRQRASRTARADRW